MLDMTNALISLNEHEKWRRKMASDKTLIELISTIWVASGGDAEGFGWLQTKIKDKIKEKEKEKDNE
jgi:hypothetical protein